MKTCSHVFAVAVAIVLAAGLCPGLAIADTAYDLAQGDMLLGGQSDDLIASGESGSCTWIIDSDGALTVRPTLGDRGELASGGWGYNDYNEGVHRTPWNKYRAEITSVKFEGTVKTPSCIGMFEGCKQLTDVDLSGLDTNGCSMDFMFKGCSSLSSIDLSPLDTTNLISTSYMFAGCSSLTSLDLSGFNTKKVEVCTCMFYNCSSLETIYVGNKWAYGTGEYTDAYYTSNSRSMFFGCTSLVGGNGTVYHVNSGGTSQDEYWNSKYARIDEPGKPGYFTRASVGDAKAGLSISATTYQYAGAPVEPSPTVTLSGNELRKGTDYEVSYTDNVDVGTATVTVIGKGNYTGTVSTTFEIVPAPITSVVPERASLVYDGNTKEPGVTVSAGSLPVPFSDYDVSYSGNVDVGTATVTVTGKENYTGTAAATFEVRPASVTTLALSRSTYTYTGKVQKPAVSAVRAGELFLGAQDYVVRYSDDNAKAAGTYTVTVTGKGNYAGSRSATFKISKAGNPMVVKAKSPSVKADKVKKKTQAIVAKKVFAVSKAQGKVTYKKASGNMKISVSNAGKVTVKKGLKKGAYKVKVKVTAKGNANYKPCSKTVTIKVRVK